ncbi:MAG: class A beta-lactamase-related serine hydrolase [Candidatus Dadabacteria bacterium]|nr:MAG: class A beta-lactamase-related serine hydrolase [Candidatus Dadabacteria bacterium]
MSNVAGQDDINSAGTQNVIYEFLKQGVKDHIFPGAVLLATQGEREVYHFAVGSRTYTKSAEENSLVTDTTVFDIDSLTLPFVTTTLIMRLCEAGRLALDDRVSRFVQGFGVYGKNKITVRHLLNQSSGLPAYIPFCEELQRENAGARMGILTSRAAREFVYNRIKRLSLKYETGTKQLYSEPGVIILGHLIEELTGQPLHKAAQQFIFHPLGLRSTSFIDLSLIRRRGIHPVRDLIAPTKESDWRKGVLCGEACNDNAWAMGGIAAHSGVFTVAADLNSFGRALLQIRKGEGSFISRETLDQFWTPGNPEDHWCLGWALPSRENSMDEAGLSGKAVGMNSDTGCSFWIDPEKSLIVVLLSNANHPGGNLRKLRGFVPELYSLILDNLPG